MPIDELQASGKYPKWTYDDMPPSLKALHQWEGVGYGVLNDGDGQVLYYRNDMLARCEHQAAFKTEYGYDLPNPPQTWQQLLDISKYFNGKNWDATDADPDSGTVLHLKVGEQGHYHFQSLSASFVINPGDKVTQTQNVYWFDPDRHEAADQQPGPCEGAGVPAGAAQDRTGGAGRLVARRGVGLFPARQGGLRLLAGATSARSARTRRARR